MRGAILASYLEKSLKEVDFDASKDDFSALKVVPKDKPVVFFCNGPECWKSYKASRAAVAAGYPKIYWFRGGMPEWRDKRLPVEGSAAAALAKIPAPQTAGRQGGRRRAVRPGRTVVRRAAANGPPAPRCSASMRGRDPADKRLPRWIGRRLGAQSADGRSGRAQVNERKSVLVIGAGDSTGGAIARRFAREGYVACVTRRTAEKLEPLVAAIRSEGGEAHGFASDARKEVDMETLVAYIEREVAPIEVAVFNVGANVRFPLVETTERVYRKVWEMGALGGFLIGPRGRPAHGRRAATARSSSPAPPPACAAASASAAFAGAKHALRALAQSMARELGPQGIHVAHVVIDGAIDTPFIAENFPERYATKERGRHPQPGRTSPRTTGTCTASRAAPGPTSSTCAPGRENLVRR